MLYTYVDLVPLIYCVHTSNVNLVLGVVHEGNNFLFILRCVIVAFIVSKNFTQAVTTTKKLQEAILHCKKSFCKRTTLRVVNESDLFSEQLNCTAIVTILMIIILLQR